MYRTETANAVPRPANWRRPDTLCIVYETETSNAWHTRGPNLHLSVGQMAQIEATVLAASPSTISHDS